MLREPADQGDLNLKYEDRVQDCVPSGFRKDDEDVQHVMASSHFDFIDKRNIDMKDSEGPTTDHPALLVTLTLR